MVSLEHVPKRKGHCKGKRMAGTCNLQKCASIHNGTLKTVLHTSFLSATI